MTLDQPLLTRPWRDVLVLIYIMELGQPQEVEKLTPITMAYDSSLGFRTDQPLPRGVVAPCRSIPQGYCYTNHSLTLLPQLGVSQMSLILPGPLSLARPIPTLGSQGTNDQDPVLSHPFQPPM